MLSLLEMNDLLFPPSFLFGAATAGYQIEGNNINSNIYHDEIRFPKNYPQRSAACCNHWEMYQSDAELFGQLGWQVYRMSIEWSRLEPEHGVFNAEALSRYLDLLERLTSHGMKVAITLHHWSHPLWFEKLGGFRNRENIHYFLDYLKYLIPKIKDYAYSFILLNEFTNHAVCQSNWPLMKNLTVAHAYAYHTVKSYTDVPAASTHAIIPWEPRNPCDELDVCAASLKDWCTNEFFIRAMTTGEMLLPYTGGEYLPELKNSFDYWGLTYYTRHFVSAKTADLSAERYPHNRVRMIDQPFYLEEFYPDGFVKLLPRFKDKPIHICENGLCADDDRLRIIYIALHLSALHTAMDLGCDVRNYMYWSAMDNYEWGTFKPRFGLIHVDFETFKRTVKPSAQFYREVIEHRGITRDLREKWFRPLCDFKTYPCDQPFATCLPNEKI